MADILIKNMEVPKSCSWFDEEGKHHSCRFCFAYVCSITGECIASSVERRHPSCPLRELPPEHGRLIDADKLKKELLEHGHPDTREWYYAEVDLFIDECPTVVEAST